RTAVFSPRSARPPRAQPARSGHLSKTRVISVTGPGPGRGSVGPRATGQHGKPPGGSLGTGPQSTSNTDGRNVPAILDKEARMAPIAVEGPDSGGGGRAVE